jgi:ABC-type antimicrobial peptide transport system permease subunit
VAERIPEIGIRRALGAPASDVVWGVMSRTLVLAGVGTVGGALLSLLSARLLASLLYGVSARDPGTYVVSALVLLGVATAAAVVPATRAARTTGLVALGKS